MNPLPLAHITGLVLAGGRGSRMGGVDKGLQPFNGMPLAQHSLQRLRPQVGQVLLNANRNLDAYAALGAPVVADAHGARGGAADEAFAGPLAGFLAGLQHCRTPYLVTVPCDTPHFPLDLVARLAAALVRDGADIAMAAASEQDDASRVLRPQPVFCLIDTRLAADLARFVAQDGRRVYGWAAQHALALVPFTADHDEATAFFNANTLADLQRLQAAPGSG
ncbi:molybdenum cofactor guanylyltransferase MobA [Rhodoferax koreense]|uniref:Molybdenum cofactor guanylyltransferase n=1 Tax=Rhodoferax koreensis TaxID=1842727 RepID=A0A1P8JW61_9BURK|nr:molybdenum cofactor guanylyltransferase MobA [Rhodoferax koreense]APW38009.1 molybdenum cofactor guanylyltransferase MobA [Rhodoferax koreense]